MFVILIIAAGIGVIVIFRMIGETKQAEQKVLEAAKYKNDINRHEELITKDNQAIFVAFDHSEYDYRPVSGETLLGVHNDVSKIELKSSGKYTSKGSSVSIPIVKGLSYRVSNRTVHSEKIWKETAHGRLLVTDKAIIFESPEKNERITWGQVSSLELLADGFQINKRSGPPRLFFTTRPDARFAATLELLSQRI